MSKEKAWKEHNKPTGLHVRECFMAGFEGGKIETARRVSIFNLKNFDKWDKETRKEERLLVIEQAKKVLDKALDKAAMHNDRGACLQYDKILDGLKVKI